MDKKLQSIIRELKSHKPFEDLLEVGVSKSVGYLPITTIIEYGPQNVLSMLESFAQMANLQFYYDYSGNTKDGALYFWDEKRLSTLLTEHEKDLMLAGIPIRPKEYINFIACNLVDEDQFPAAYMVIGKSFNDHRFRKKEI